MDFFLVQQPPFSISQGIAGKEEWQSIQELIELRDSINRQLVLCCVPMTDAVQRKAKASPRCKPEYVR